MPNELEDRKLKVLRAVIDSYILNAEPVGSRTIAKKSGINISSATIRNEMSDLEDMGYLKQPHTSAGRIPSNKGYRLYVDRLMKVKALSEMEADSIKKIFNKKIDEIEDIVTKTARIISDTTNYTSIVLAPSISKVRIRRVQLVEVSKEFVLLVIVTSSGIIKDTVFKISSCLDSNHLNRISNIITEMVQDMRVSDINYDVIEEIRNRLKRETEFFTSLVDALTDSIHTKESDDLYYGGTTNIFNFPEYHDVLKAKAFLNMLEEKDILYSMLSSEIKDGVSVVIGDENKHKNMKDCSIVTATYKIGRRVIGTMGIIGPTRMEYSKAVSVLDFMGKSLSSYLTKLFDE